MFAAERAQASDAAVPPGATAVDDDQTEAPARQEDLGSARGVCAAGAHESQPIAADAGTGQIGRMRQRGTGGDPRDRLALPLDEGAAGGQDGARSGADHLDELGPRYDRPGLAARRRKLGKSGRRGRRDHRWHLLDLTVRMFSVKIG
jgi:hypothetical protein